MYTRILISLCLLAAVLAGSAPADARSGHPARVVLIARDGTLLKETPNARARTLTTLVQQTQARVLAERRHWIQVQIWASVRGWIDRRDLVASTPWPTVSTYRPPATVRRLRAHGPLRLTASARVLAATGLFPTLGARPIGSLTAGTTVLVRAWQQDGSGSIWYQIGQNWAPGEQLQFENNWSFRTNRDSSIWHPVAGKGMWLTLGTVTSTPADILVRAAVQIGVSHLYVEAAISPLGFHGRGSVSALIEIAHRHHISVIAWVYPYFDDVAADVALTREVAAFRTRTGAAFDGIAADLERNINLWNVRAYGQLVRRYVGANYLLVGVTYPPQSQTNVPFGEIARQFNVIAPMDYWHQTKTTVGLDYAGTPYGREYTSRYATDSIATIRRADASIPIAPIGQTFDDFGRLEMGPYAPSADEIRGFLSGCKSGGAIGSSFFQWMTATEPEWQVIHDFRY